MCYIITAIINCFNPNVFNRLIVMVRKIGKMKKCLIIIVLIFSLFNNSCQKRITSEGVASDYNGIITGSDLRKCSCCGELMINLMEKHSLIPVI
jgi:hypothetical protein